MSKRTAQWLTDLLHNEQGASSLEVALLVILIALAAYAGIGLLGETEANRPNQVSTAVN